jgi:histidinol dehydrogenase
MRKINYGNPQFRQEIEALRRKLMPRGDVVSLAGRAKTMEVFGEPLSPWDVVRRICDDIRERGAAAVIHYTKALDDVLLSEDDLRVSEEQLQRAHDAASPSFLAAVRTIRANIATFQESILQEDITLSPRPGVSLQQVYRPLKRIGICVPGGAAAYPSTILMTAIPAIAAGVSEIAVVTPPTPFGAHHPDVLATCHELGIHEVYRVGGAQGVAALAYGAGSIAAVDKIVGPGNIFVALAKKYVFGDVDIDSIAGPSEIVILADDSVEPKFIAADMLAQAEHSPGSSIMITWSPKLWDSIEEQIERQLRQLTRSELTRASLEQFGALILVEGRREAVELANEFAPEHLQISASQPKILAQQITTAGAVFLGNFSPVALGDYLAGPSHVLPTGGTARFAHGLCANDFRRSHSVIQYSQKALESTAAIAQEMATKEGLTAHWESIAIRCRKLENHE